MVVTGHLRRAAILSINPRVDPNRDHLEWARSVYLALPSQLLSPALTHRSLESSRTKNYEELEWLGDSPYPLSRHRFPHDEFRRHANVSQGGESFS